MDPLGALATAVIGWLIEHVSFLREPLDWLTGNGDKIKAAVATWNQVATDLHGIGEQQDKAVKSSSGNRRRPITRGHARGGGSSSA